MINAHSRLARGLLASTAAMTLVALIGGAAGATDIQGQHTVSNHQKLDQSSGSEGAPIPLSATANGHYTVQTGSSPTLDSTLSLDGNHQSAEIAGNAASSTLAATTVSTDDEGSDESTPFAALINRQSGDGTVKATSRMSVAFPGDLAGSSVALTNNANSALARMNDASNTMSVDAVELSGNALLISSQSAKGSVSAKAISHTGTGTSDTTAEAARLSVQDNTTAAEATANRALNSLSVSSVTVRGGTPVLANHQKNEASVDATTNAKFTGKGDGALQSAVSIDGNAASSLARGNAAENRMTVSSVGGSRPLERAFPVPTTDGAALASRQINNGSVSAKTVVGARVALNCDCTYDNRIGLTDNAGVASAYGNAALNAATVNGSGQPTVLVSNVQVNRGAISAVVTGRFGGAMHGGVDASMVTVSGNSLAATAVGNQAVNTLAISR